MSTFIVPGHRTWSMTRDAEGHREYTLKYLVIASPTDGPHTVSQTPGLPLPGSFWAVDNDLDLWAYCKWDLQVTPVVENEKNRHWELEYTFTTKPQGKHCKDVEIEDPLLEPPKISGTFIKYQEEAVIDRHNKPIVNSAHEQIRGPQVEFDMNRQQIRIEQNSLVLERELFSPMVDTVNQDELWGFPPRCIKLSNVSWERKYWGQCDVYYTRIMEFDVNVKRAYTHLTDIGFGDEEELVSGFDRDILDEGTKVLQGNWLGDEWVLEDIDGAPPNPDDPTHFKKAHDREGNPCKLVLNGRGKPAHVIAGTRNTFVSIQATNQNHPLYDTEWWIPINEPIDFDTPWAIDLNYRRGTIVLSVLDPETGEGSLYVALKDNTGIDPSGFVTEPDPEVWALVAANPEDLGAGGLDPWSDAENYGLGELVIDLEETSAGKIHVEKYQESDFLLLGIPTILE